MTTSFWEAQRFEKIETALRALPLRMRLSFQGLFRDLAFLSLMNRALIELLAESGAVPKNKLADRMIALSEESGPHAKVIVQGIAETLGVEMPKPKPKPPKRRRTILP